MSRPYDELLERQAGRLSRAQALELGISDRAVTRRCNRGEWSRPLPGVIALDDRDPPRGRIWQCALYAGADAVVDWPTVGQVLHWDAMPSFAPTVHLAVSEQRRVRPQDGLVVRRVRSLAAHAVRVRGYPPLLAIPETLLQAASEVSFGRLRAIVDCAMFRKDVRPEELARVTGAGGRGLRGAPILAKAAATWHPEFEAVGEARFFELMAAAGVALEPQPAMSWPDGTVFWLDFVERGTQNYFEIDSQAHHSSRAARRRDARRDKRVRELGGDVERIEGTDVLHHPRRVVADALAFLRARRAA